jgi:hypothetical protein
MGHARKLLYAWPSTIPMLARHRYASDRLANLWTSSAEWATNVLPVYVNLCLLYVGFGLKCYLDSMCTGKKKALSVSYLISFEAFCVDN